MSQESKGRRALIFDVETFGDVTDSNRDAITPIAAKKEKSAEDYAGLCPPLARVACISWLDADNKLAVAYDATLAPQGEAEPGPLAVVEPLDASRTRDCATYACAGEASLLDHFGAVIEKHFEGPEPSLITYNGRGFDLPVLIQRSLIHEVRPGVRCLFRAMRENRYAPLLHIDLMDVVTFTGAATRYPLATYSIGFGAASPKAEMDGSQVGDAVRGGRIVDVARYCATDVLATALLFERVKPIIALGGERPR